MLISFPQDKLFIVLGNPNILGVEAHSRDSPVHICCIRQDRDVCLSVLKSVEGSRSGMCNNNMLYYKHHPIKVSLGKCMGENQKEN